MTAYRRNWVPGGSYFFTVNLADRSARLLVDNVDALRAAFREARRRHHFTVEAIVVLPEHLHCILTLPPGDADFATRLKTIKALFSRGLPKDEGRTRSRIAKGERGIWQRRYWEHTLRDEVDWERHVDYIHFNPVKHEHVECVCDWPYSSFHRFVRLGLLPKDWGGGEPATKGGDFGERG
jgi:putative transposase